MKICTKCNLSFDDDKKFCKKCGGSLTSEYQIDPKNVAKKTVLEDRLKVDPLNTELLHEYAQFLFNNLLFKEAITASFKILAINENDNIAKELLFKAYYKLNMLKETLDIGKQLLAEKPTDIFLLEELAKIASVLGNSDIATEYFDQILSLQPSNSAALYSKALILLEKNQIEQAIEIFKKIFNEGQNDRITAIYVGIDKAINADYKAAFDLLSPVMNDDKQIQNDVNNNRGFLYLVYSLCQSATDFTLIQHWVGKIDLKILRRTHHPVDEQTVVKVAEYIINHGLNNITPSPEANNQITNLTNSYLPDGYFTPNSNSKLADIWFSVGNKQVELKLLADSINSFQKACDLMPAESKYKEKYAEIKKLLEADTRKKNRKANLGIAAAIVGVIIIVVSVLTYMSFAEKKVFELAKKENTIGSFQNYLNKYPKGKYSDEIKMLQEDAKWNDIKNNNTFSTFKAYLEEYPNNRHFENKNKPYQVIKEVPYYNFKSGDVSYFNLKPGQTTGWIWIKNYFIINFYSNNDFTIVYSNGYKTLMKQGINLSIPAMTRFKIESPQDKAVIAIFETLETNPIKMDYIFNSNHESYFTDYVFKKGENHKLIVKGYIETSDNQIIEPGNQSRHMNGDGVLMFYGEPNSELTIIVNR